MNELHTPRDEAWEAMKRGDYEAALMLYDAKAAREPGSVTHLNNKAYAALSLERFDEARDILANLQRGYERTAGPYSGRAKLAVATWLCGETANAIEILRVELAAIERGSTGYLDDGFGVNEGEIFYYFGAAISDPRTIDTARRYLEGRNRKPLGKSWPPGLLNYLLDIASEEETFEIIRGGAVSEDASEMARSTLIPRAEIKFDFCRAIKAHARAGKHAAQPIYVEIASRPNPILTYEWYLSRAEAKPGVP
jgi:hypothetical protein